MSNCRFVSSIKLSFVYVVNTFTHQLLSIEVVLTTKLIFTMCWYTKMSKSTSTEVCILLESLTEWNTWICIPFWKRKYAHSHVICSKTSRSTIGYAKASLLNTNRFINVPIRKLQRERIISTSWLMQKCDFSARKIRAFITREKPFAHMRTFYVQTEKVYIGHNVLFNALHG